MSANTSATGGYLQPTDPNAAPPDDLSLDVLIQRLVVGVSGLPGPSVRPRWQPEPPQQPRIDEDWCAVGVTDVVPDGQPWEEHDSAGDGSTTVSETEMLEVHATFYGPNARRLAERTRRGLYLRQNREALFLVSMALVAAGPLRNTPTQLQGTTWRRAVDLRIDIRRRTDDAYPVLNVLGMLGSLTGDGGSILGTPGLNTVPLEVKGDN